MQLPGLQTAQRHVPPLGKGGPTCQVQNLILISAQSKKKKKGAAWHLQVHFLFSMKEIQLVSGSHSWMHTRVTWGKSSNTLKCRAQVKDLSSSPDRF